MVRERLIHCTTTAVTPAPVLGNPQDGFDGESHDNVVEGRRLTRSITSAKAQQTVPAAKLPVKGSKENRTPAVAKRAGAVLPARKRKSQDVSPDTRTATPAKGRIPSKAISTGKRLGVKAITELQPAVLAAASSVSAASPRMTRSARLRAASIQARISNTPSPVPPSPRLPHLKQREPLFPPSTPRTARVELTAQKAASVGSSSSSSVRQLSPVLAPDATTTMVEEERPAIAEMHTPKVGGTTTFLPLLLKPEWSGKQRVSGTVDRSADAMDETDDDDAPAVSAASTASSPIPEDTQVSPNLADARVSRTSGPWRLTPSPRRTPSPDMSYLFEDDDACFADHGLPPIYHSAGEEEGWIEQPAVRRRPVSAAPNVTDPEDDSTASETAAAKKRRPKRAVVRRKAGPRGTGSTATRAKRGKAKPTIAVPTEADKKEWEEQRRFFEEIDNFPLEVEVVP